LRYGGYRMMAATIPVRQWPVGDSRYDADAATAG
jgi:hypothetical protein